MSQDFLNNSPSLTPADLVFDSTGTLIAPESMTQTITSNASGQVTSISATDGTGTWLRTFTYPSSLVIVKSPWVKQ